MTKIIWELRYGKISRMSKSIDRGSILIENKLEILFVWEVVCDEN